ncbi:MAG: NUDIX domain-containing protein [Acidimicrobiia bacterium]|nr:NUDIX domain-containing protein [Acidimicrobiia bacterium]
MRLRNSAKAVIVSDGRLLVQRNESPSDPEGHWMLLPGGGQRPGETLHDTLVREVREETGYDVEVGPLLWLREYVGRNHEFAHFNAEEHQIEYMFAATVVGGDGRPSEADRWQVDVVWLPAEDITGARLYPMSMRPVFAAYAAGEAAGEVYRGDVN